MLKTSLNLDTQCARDALDPGYVTTHAHAHAWTRTRTHRHAHVLARTYTRAHTHTHAWKIRFLRKRNRKAYRQNRPIYSSPDVPIFWHPLTSNLVNLVQPRARSSRLRSVSKWQSFRERSLRFLHPLAMAERHLTYAKWRKPSVYNKVDKSQPEKDKISFFKKKNKEEQEIQWQ